MTELVEQRHISDLEQAISVWEETLPWIANGWDCLEEYQYDLYQREIVDEYMSCMSGLTVPDELLSRLNAADNIFRDATVASHLCIWHVATNFRHCNGEFEFTFVDYDINRFWFYYRWQPDAQYPFRDYDSYSYQREMYGLDFQTMTNDELIEAAQRMVQQWADLRIRCSRGEATSGD